MDIDLSLSLSSQLHSGPINMWFYAGENEYERATPDTISANGL